MPVQPFRDRRSRSRRWTICTQRLSSTRLVPQDDATDWEAGTSPAYLRQLVDYWRSQYDWRAQEAQINRFAHFRATVGGTTLHFIHERGRGDAPLPIVLTHGFPDSFLRFLKLIPLLTDPAAHGGDPRDAFDVVVPSLPGYGFSDKPDKAGSTFHIGDLWHELMTDELGYERFGAHGGDWGSTVTEHLARSHAASVVGIHLTDVPFWHAFQKPGDLEPRRGEVPREDRRVPDAGRRLRDDPGDAPANAGGRLERFAGRPRGLDRREVPALERLRRRRRKAVHQGRAAHEHHALLGDRRRSDRRSCPTTT